MLVPKSENALLGNAEENSMGRAVVGGVKVDNNISPRRAAIEKAQAALRQEYDVREERKKELEFLEKGGNPLDFKADLATSTSPHSTSVTDQFEEQFVISEARGSATLPVSPFADSVESSGRLGSLLSKDLSNADNLFVFDGDDKMTEGKRNSFHLSKSRARVGNASLLKESDSAILRHEVKGQAYARRNRSRPNRENAHWHSTNLINSGDTNVSFNVPSVVSEPKDVKRLTCEEEMTAGPRNISTYNSEAVSPNVNVDSRLLDSDNQHMCADGSQIVETKIEFVDNPLPNVLEVTTHSDNGQVFQVPNEPDNHTDIAIKDVKNLVAGQPDCGHDKVFDVIQNPGSLSDDFDLSAEDGNNVHNEDQKKECGLSKNEITDSVENDQIETGNLLTDIVCCDHVDTEKKLNSAPFNDFTLLDETVNEAHDGDQMKELDHAPDPGDQMKELDHAPDPDLIVNEQIEINSLVPDKLGCDINAPDAGLIVNKQIEINSSAPDKLGYDANELSKVYTPPSQEVSTVFDVVRLKDNNVATDVLSDDSKVNDAKASSTTHIDEPYDGNTNQRGLENPDEVGASKQDCSNALNHDTISKNDNLMEGGSVNFLPPFENEPLVLTESQLCVGSPLEGADDDAILEKARIIEVNRKRLVQFPASSFCSEIRRKSHWDFVIEEMAWLANDFIQERAWKIAAASQVSHLVALTGRSKLNDTIVRQKQKIAAHSLAKAVIEFWNSAKVLSRKNVSDSLEPLSNCSMIKDVELRGNDTPDMSGIRNFKTREDHHSVLAYAIRFLKDNVELSSSSAYAVAPRTPDRLYDSGIMASSENAAELRVNLFFSVPFGAMENYRKSVESLWMHYEKNGDGIHSDERLTAWLDSESGALENTYEEDECDPDMLYFPESADKFSRSAHKKKNLKKHMQRTYDNESELAYGNCNNLHIVINGKRPLSSSHVGSIPTKRARTAARQRVSGPLTSVPTQMIAKTDVYSGDTCSYQDDQSSQHGEPQTQKNFEVESTGEYSRQLPDGTSISMKHKKKKKGYKNSLHTADSDTYLFPAGESAQDHRWQWESHEQKRKLEAHNFDSNASNGPGSTPSVASQISNMVYPNKFMKLFANRGPGKKAKALKISGVSSGAGGPWSVVEDQALVVLVHDMGPNWELVTDIMNSALHFKCVFRKPKECRERHKILMDRNSGDGADSAEDSGSSQPYPSTLPGIPKGSARQLFQHLQGPLEQDVLKSHFEKIIKIGQHLHLERNQNNNYEAKQIIPVHGSHVIALSQVCPNGINNAILTPLDLCDATSSSPDAQSLGYPGSHSGGMPVSHQGSLSSTISSSFVNNAVQVTSPMALNNGFTPTSAALSPSSRYGGPRSAPAQLDEHQRIQQYNQMISGRNVQQSNMPGALQVGNDRSVRMVPGSNGLGMICSMNRGVGIPRQGFQGMGSAPMLNMISPGSVIPNSGLPGPVNIHAGNVSGQGNSLPRPRESLAAIRPGQNPEDQRRMMQEFQMQGPQGHCQGAPPSFSGMNPAFTNPMVTSPVQNIPLQHHAQQQLHLLNGPQHPQLQGANSGSPQQQAFVNRVAKDRQIQQRFMPQQQQFTSTNSSVSYPTGPPQFQAHHPVSPIQNGLQPSAAVSLPMPSAQHSLSQSSSQQGSIPTQPNSKLNQTSQGIGQLGVSLTNQALLKRQRQQQLLQQQRSHISQNRQQGNSVQQAKHAKGLGRGNLMMHQNFPIESAHVNNLSSPSEILEKGEPAMQQMILTQGVYSGPSGLNACQPGRQLLPQPSNSLQHQQKQFPRAHSHKQVSLPNGHADGNNQGQAIQVQPNQILPSSLSPVSSSSLSMQTSLSRPSLQRMLPSSNLQRCHSDVPLSGPLDQNHPIHMSSNSNATHCTDASIAPSVSPASSSTSHWKIDSPSCDSSVTVPSHRHLTNNGCMSQRTSSRVEPGQTSQPMGQRQCVGNNTLAHESNTDDQWLQDSQFLQQQNRQLIQQHQSIDAGSLCSQPTNSGSG